MTPLRPEDLRRPHPSKPRNRKLAEALFDAGWIEQWGSGFERMLRACRQTDLPEPTWEERAGAFWLTFRKDILTEDYLRGLGLNDRQIRAVLHVRASGQITNTEYQQFFEVSKRTTTDELGKLERQGSSDIQGLMQKSGTPTPPHRQY